MDSELRLTEIADRVFVVIGDNGSANSGFVVGDDAVALIDGQASPRLGAVVRELVTSVTGVPVRYAVITHHHGDHLFGIQAWPEVLVLAHPRCRAVLNRLIGGVSTEGPSGALNLDSMLRIFVGDRAAHEIRQLGTHSILTKLSGAEFADVHLVVPQQLPIHAVGETFAIPLGGIELTIRYQGPAHGDDDLVVEIADRGVIFLGDLGFVDRLPAVTSPYLGEWTAITDRYLRSGWPLIVPGHGLPSATNGLQTQYEYLNALHSVAKHTMEPDGLAAFAGLSGFDRWNSVNVAVALTDAAVIHRG
jgi:glyoxylase-like metal-dependent hydrolase (beta-lactamase superfamily II)